MVVFFFACVQQSWTTLAGVSPVTVIASEPCSYIPRDAQTLMHPEVAGLFPAGEGAGYAGGIISAALDGERIADAVVNYLKK